MRRNQIELYYILAEGKASEFDYYDKMDLFDFRRLYQSFVKKKSKEKEAKDGIRGSSGKMGSRQR